MNHGSGRKPRPGDPAPLWRPRGRVSRRAGPVRRAAAHALRVGIVALYVVGCLVTALLGAIQRGIGHAARWRAARVAAGACALIAWVLVAGPRRVHEPTQWPFVGSPNVDERPRAAHVDAVVLHATEINTLVDTIGCFRSPATKVSAHFVVDRDGTVVQMVPMSRRAWHAGRSALQGVPNVNHYSVGIEMVNLGDGKDPYPPAQVRAVAEIVRQVRRHFHVPDHRIVRHADVARPVGRKVDPLGFDLRAFRRLCRGLP